MSYTVSKLVHFLRHSVYTITTSTLGFQTVAKECQLSCSRKNR